MQVVQPLKPIETTAGFKQVDGEDVGNTYCLAKLVLFGQPSRLVRLVEDNANCHNGCSAPDPSTQGSYPLAGTKGGKFSIGAKVPEIPVVGEQHKPGDQREDRCGRPYGPISMSPKPTAHLQCIITLAKIAAATEWVFPRNSAAS